MIRQSGEEPEVIEYLKHPPSRARLVELIGKIGNFRSARCCAKRARPMRNWGLADPKWSDEELIDFMLAHPILIQPADCGDAEGRAALPAVGSGAGSARPSGGVVRERGRRSRHAGEIIDSLFRHGRMTNFALKRLAITTLPLHHPAKPFVTHDYAA